MLKAAKKMAPISHFSILLLKHVPKEFHSHVWATSVKKHAAEGRDEREDLSPRDACRGFIHAVSIDYNSPEDSPLAHPTAYLRVRTDQRWVVCIVPFPVERTVRSFKGVDCQVIFSGECSTPIERAMLNLELLKQGTMFNDDIYMGKGINDVRHVGEVYKHACKSLAELVMVLGGRTERLSLLETWIDALPNEAAFPLETAEAIDSLDDEYWESLSCKGKDTEYPRFMLPHGLVDTFSPDMAYVTEPVGISKLISQERAIDYAERFDPLSMKNGAAVFEAIDFAGSSNMVPALFLASRPQEQAYSGVLIYRPWLGKHQRLDRVSIVALGVNMDERRQGYGRQLCGYLARMYPNCTIHCRMHGSQYETMAFFKGIGAEVERLGDTWEACFSLTDLFPVEAVYRKKLKESRNKRKK